MLISHPQSKFQGQRYPYPVELIDIYPTLRDIMKAPLDKASVCRKDAICHDLQGKSLAPIILGDIWDQEYKTMKSQKNSPFVIPKAPAIQSRLANGMPLLERDFAITQMWRCARKDQVLQELENRKQLTPGQKLNRRQIWFTCDMDKKAPYDDEISLMGYSMRSPFYRYTLWLHFNRVQFLPVLDALPFAEELYDHKDETFGNFTHMETSNLVHKPGYETIASKHRQQLLEFIRKEIIFRGPFKP